MATQASQFHSRERRRSLAGVPELFRTHLIRNVASLPVATVAGEIFPRRNQDITLKTAIHIAANTTARAGLIFEIGSSVAGLALWMTNQTISLRAGATGNNGVVAAFDNGVQWPAGLELSIVAAVRPGLGLAALWLNGREVAKTQSVANSFTNGEWSAPADGSFASAVLGTTPADVGETGAPANFAVVEALSVYVGSRPRQFLEPV